MARRSTRRGCHRPVAERLESRAMLAAPGPGWQLLWSDEFSGTALDQAKWDVATNPRRQAINSADAVKVADGALTITTYTEAGKHHTGFIGTRADFQATFGYWEARIRFQDSPGMWSAFWVQSPTIGTPLGDVAAAGSEIDVVEHRVRDAAGADISNKSVSNLHWDGYGSAHRSIGSGLVANPSVAPLQGNYHDYAVEWSPAGYRFFIDGRQVWSTSQAVSARSQFIYLTSEVQDASWAGRIPAAGYGSLATSRTTMSVDWVRVWQKPITDVPNLTITDGGSAAVPVTVTSWSGQPTTLAVQSSNAALLPASAVVVEGSGATRTVRVNPVPGVGGTATVTLAADGGRIRGSDTFTVTVTPGSFRNGGFEAATGWKPYAGGSIVGGGQRTGLRAARIVGFGGIEQLVTGLLPNTTYQLSGFGRVSVAGTRNVIGVKNYGGVQKAVDLSATTWGTGTVEFTTGATQTSAVVFVYKPTTTGTGLFDDLVLRVKPAVTAEGFAAALATPTVPTVRRLRQVARPA